MAGQASIETVQENTFSQSTTVDPILLKDGAGSAQEHTTTKLMASSTNVMPTLQSKENLCVETITLI